MSGRRQRLAGDHPLGARGEDLQVPAGEHAADRVHLVRHRCRTRSPRRPAPVPRSKLNRSPERDSQSRFGRSREPPITSRSWWKQAETGQPRTARRRLVPVRRRVGVGQRPPRPARRLRARTTVGDDALLAADAGSADAGMAGDEHRRDAVRVTVPVVALGVTVTPRRRSGTRAGGSHCPRPGRPSPPASSRLPRPRELARRHVGMTDQQRVGALGPGELRQLRPSTAYSPSRPVRRHDEHRPRYSENASR